ncbi:cdc42 effector protein 3 [Paralichthys olivaceus]|uniref:cdc42 effector protein 3 n=1 Tax=Paralichthys olivaceus TaxID=8255 RepID=UPI00097DD159|nr:PREDICTED: cdc42 effector protein 3-like [Paralichthys olivaceus]
MPLRTSLYRKQSSARWPGRNSKRREVLSVNMISLPLADFRHITHIGNNAHTDSFGDLSFLKMGHNLLLQSSQSEQNLFMACSPPPKPPRLNLDETDGSESPDWSAGHHHSSYQRRKKCSSMPLLDSNEVEEELEKMDGDQRGTNVAYGPGRGSASSEKDGDTTDICENTTGKQKDEDSGFSFSLDLGPSILDEVLQVMDKQNN